MRQLRRSTAEAEVVIAEENEKRGKAAPVYVVNRVTSKGNATAYLLRRLARDHPDILAAYQRDAGRL